jgi:hypothetical protein
MKYRREIKPATILPPDLLRGFYGKEEGALLEASQWVEKNGLILMFTLQKASGCEKVWVDQAEGKVYLGWDKLPKIDDLYLWLGAVDMETLRRARSEGWTKKEIFKVLERNPL